MLEKLKRDVYEANISLPRLGLVTFTWGNVSGIDRERGLFVIKPSGVSYDDLKPDDLVVVNLDGKIIEGDMNPSSDTPTHTVLYNQFPDIGGIVHTHSPWAVAFASARMDIPILNTTAADTFYGPIPVSEPLTRKQIENNYEKETGEEIAKTFLNRNISPLAVPAILVAQHGPFCWGRTPKEAVYTAKVLETVAEMDYHALELSHQDNRVPQYLMDKHYLRKHGTSAYYGQNGSRRIKSN
ncbi:L-ribulose-5-phosphate 4-epimerase [Lacticaseibacillus paracasei]|jgi:L-ribulose-5-phosphate 4-epimerase|uniref:L-ribulose-5-phosphate 4-epimerase n=2 Tax=Lacticaseibacillus paracasei TaxID=1597 RepID=A0A0C9QEQ3_LACPA|nr:L-ribulose-5-phosphate 4-epimerase [Lacticaseibacillus paracasei]MDB1563669.1 L-ribulose-5-phosphate 4-epimerase [Lacticaseibacillus paracasei]MDS0491319.1 L-ribulose-5-phosphate 4-epimerase [Lacticaseibacillus paracasei]MEA0974552.1 L-ribulose-5-phosphate 4-epimerase [Lacticaseibacillus paracasei]QPC17902.1 L-ribulose-5-phosphate 4-epimerase [Lacticaseibacillus paracasei subsp. tolerans]QXJ69096.1 L-ribulose-5-phosphate 4-epimerase [Lacticaseibacillus paracasei subsp. paracasei]